MKRSNVWCANYINNALKKLKTMPDKEKIKLIITILGKEELKKYFNNYKTGGSNS